MAICVREGGDVYEGQQVAQHVAAVVVVYSLLKPPLMITFIFLIRRGTSLRNLGIIDGFLCRMKDVSDTAAVRGNNHAYR